MTARRRRRLTRALLSVVIFAAMLLASGAAGLSYGPYELAVVALIAISLVLIVEWSIHNRIRQANDRHRVNS